MLNNNILIVDNDRVIRDSLSDLLTQQGYQPSSVSSFDEALHELEKRRFSIVITVANLPGHDALQLLKIINRHYPTVLTIVISEYASVNKAVEVVKEGAFDYLTKPVNETELLNTLKKASEKIALLNDKHNMQQGIENTGLHNIIGCDQKMMEIYQLIESASPTRATVLITGSSGTGKSMIASAIHQLSDRADKPFIEVSCGSLPETLLESELFGHVKGAFTGAVSDKEGKFLAANGGTIFLDEINSASPALQVKLLRVLQQRKFEPVGSNITHDTDVRILLATNKNLTQLIEKGQFREDLYYRINVINIDLPDLTQRPADITMLAEHFLKKLSSFHGKSFSGFSPDTLAALESYSWPGNVRELENAVERAVVLSRNKQISLYDLPNNIVEKSGTVLNAPPSQNSISLKKALEQPEKEIIVNTLKQCGWNRNKTAEILEINRTTLYKKMKYYNLYAG